MKIGAVATLRGARPHGVTAAPAFSGFVIAHRGDNVVVDVTGFLDGRRITGGVLLGKFGDRAVEGHEVVRLQVAFQIWFRRSRETRKRRFVQGDSMLATHRRESKLDIKSGGGLCFCRRENSEVISVLRIAALGIPDGTVN